ncbi:MAG TPA: CDP-alcohol phosphatidyltransferase [Erysipelotrichaceae bacterium]|nr:CDP-alcohol phosphatidyltransferase [Erysipelotrichaceae bacterium]HBZ41696.1 CDP-alcohol phosphatidyltransferase [Erysipelotrichaceae bacterium]
MVMNMWKYIPNTLTCIRIFLSLLLLIFPPFSFPFTFIFIVCGFTDVLDGWIARKMNVISEIGAKLDSFADFMVITIVLLRILPRLLVPKLAYPWLLVILLVRLVSVSIGLLKYRTICFLHTYTNKVTGMMIFSLPILLLWIDVSIVLFISCLLATISSVEELLINATSVRLDRNVKSLFS